MGVVLFFLSTSQSRRSVCLSLSGYHNAVCHMPCVFHANQSSEPDKKRKRKGKLMQKNAPAQHALKKGKGKKEANTRNRKRKKRTKSEKKRKERCSVNTQVRSHPLFVYFRLNVLPNPPLFARLLVGPKLSLVLTRSTSYGLS